MAQRRAVRRSLISPEATTLTRRTWAEIDLDAIAHNVRALCALIAPATFMAVIKADGYGHGAVQVSRATLDAGATWLGVATVEEGIVLRRAGLTVPVLVLGVLGASELAEALAHGLHVSIGSLDAVEALMSLAPGTPPVGVHLDVDTGMGRLGVFPQQVPRVLDALDRRGISLDGCYTQLACADDPDPTFTREQLARFHGALAEVHRRHPHVIVHVANSAAALAHPETLFDMVRVGLALYGLYPAAHLRDRVSLRPAMALKSRVVRVTRAEAGMTIGYGATYRVRAPTTVATIACGYADGYPRLTSNKGEVVIGEQRHPIAGRVTMDHMMVDAGDRSLATGDETILFGHGVTVEEVAAWAQTISYEVVCRVGPRVPRIYLRNGRPMDPGAL